MSEFECNINDVALIFEGGGMRASYSCAIAAALLKNHLYFPHVYGVSAGSSNAVNYVSRDIVRTHDSFTKLVLDPEFGGTRSFLEHKGFFNAHYLYDEAGLPDSTLPFDYRTFAANPAQVTVAAFERDTGKTVYRTKDDWDSTADVMNSVRASSTLPIVMPPTTINDRVCYDGGLAEDHGMLVSQARRDGFERFFVVRTRPKGYRKSEGGNAFVKAFFWHRPKMRDALDRWGREYNELCDELERMGRTGQALVVYADTVTAENSSTDYELLEENYRMGTDQAKRDLEKWLRFLGL